MESLERELGEGDEVLSEAEISAIEERALGKALSPELRQRIVAIYEGEGENGMMPESDEEELRRIEKIGALLREHGYSSAEEKLAKSKQESPSSGFSGFLLRVRQALHL